MELKESVLNLILQAEKGYQDTIKQSIMKAEQYAEESKERQSAYLAGLNRDWDSFEATENDKFERMLVEEEQNMEIEMAKKKEQLKLCQEEKADLISERLKKEVLSLYGSS